MTRKEKLFFRKYVKKETNKNIRRFQGYYLKEIKNEDIRNIQGYVYSKYFLWQGSKYTHLKKVKNAGFYLRKTNNLKGFQLRVEKTRRNFLTKKNNINSSYHFSDEFISFKKKLDSGLSKSITKRSTVKLFYGELQKFFFYTRIIVTFSFHFISKS
jgi:hypothetical protein